MIDYSRFYNFKVSQTTQTIYASKKLTLLINSYDDNGNSITIGGQNFTVSLMNSNGFFEYFVKDHRNGTYSIDMKCFKKGNFTIDISFYAMETQIIRSIPPLNFTNTNQINVLAYLCNTKFSQLKSGKK